MDILPRQLQNPHAPPAATRAPPLEWVGRGAFKIARPSLRLLAKLDVYDAEFREFARSKRGSWAHMEKAWAFPAAKEIEILAGLDELSAKMAARLAHNEEIGQEVAAAMSIAPFEFASANFKVRWDGALSRFHVSFPFDDNMGARLRNMGGRWDRDLKCHLAPAGALPGLLEITAPIARERLLFAERNAAWAEREHADPLAVAVEDSSPGSAKEGWARAEVEADLLERSYEVKFPFGLNSPLGREFLAPALQDSGCLDIVRIEDRERLYPKLREVSASFELCQRDKLEAGLRAANASLAELGPAQELRFAEGAALDWVARDRRAGPQPGEVLIAQGRAWLVSKVQRTKARVMVKGHPLSAKQAQDRIERGGQPMKWRVATLAGIDITALDAYVESLFLREASQGIREEPRSVKPRRI